ncbi:hypothetical protein HaLaN_30942, partial [Haematococcus lacustris]
DQLARWKLTKGQVKHASGLNNSCHDTEHLAAASSAGTSLEANLKHISVTLATWDAVWELEGDMAEVSMERHGRAKQLAPCSSQAATPAAASEPGTSTPPPAKRSKRIEAEQAAESTQPTKAAKAKPAPLGRAEQGKLPAKGKEYPGLSYKAQQQQQRAEAQ